MCLKIFFYTDESCRVGGQSVGGEFDCMTCDLALSPVFTFKRKYFNQAMLYQ